MSDDEFDDIISEVEADADDIVIDLSQETKMEPVPDGRYLTRVVGFKVGPQIKSGNGELMVKIQFQYADDNPEYAKKKSWRSYMLEGAGVGFLTDFLEHAGLPVDRSVATPRFSRKALLDAAPFTMVWTKSEYNPKYNDVEIP